jgi:LysM repeat protein
MFSHHGHRTTLNTIQMKKTLLAVFLLLSTYLSFAQAPLLVHSNNKGLYVVHTVAPKENFYSIGRLYSISPKEIVAFNGVDMANGLSIGQKLMIPLMAGNFSQTTQKGLPVIYVVGDGEGLMKVSEKNNNVLLTNLRQWNNLSSDAVSKGQSLVVGYINATDQIPAVVVKTETPKQEVVAVKPEPKQEVPTQRVEKKPEPVVEKKQEQVAETKGPETKPVPTNVSNQQMAVGGAGYFKPQYDQQSKKYGSNKDLTVTSGVFKTASGWQDAKYYALIDNVEPGTIIRVVNPDNNKAVFAKVLGEMTGIRQNQGLDVRISNAAASALNVTDTDKFIVKVNY